MKMLPCCTFFSFQGLKAGSLQSYATVTSPQNEPCMRNLKSLRAGQCLSPDVARHFQNFQTTEVSAEIPLCHLSFSCLLNRISIWLPVTTGRGLKLAEIEQLTTD